MGFISHIQAGCCDCEKSWSSKNAVAVAKIHATKYGHTTWYDMVISGQFEGNPSYTKKLKET